MDDIQRSLVICRECSERDGQPFWIACGSEFGRRTAERQHTVVGHDARSVPGWPSPHAAWEHAFGREQR